MCFWGQSAEDGGLDAAGWLRGAALPAAEDPYNHTHLTRIQHNHTVSSGLISTAFSSRVCTVGVFHQDTSTSDVSVGDFAGSCMLLFG